jgi:histidinol-phosphatase
MKSSHFLNVAMAAVDKAEQICLKHYRKLPKVETKSDNTPVTIADRDSEAAMIDIIRRQFPDHGFLGEETGDNSARKEFVWIIDPIDGTKNFIHQIPLWGNLLALMHDGRVVLGISNVPLMGERVWAEKDRGAYLNGRRIHVSSTRIISGATLSYAKSIKLPHDRRDRAIFRLMHAVNRQRAFGDLWPYHLLASGRIDIVVEIGIRAYDVAPFVCILPEAGGMTSDLSGKPFTPDIREFLATNGGLHRHALQCFATSKK